MAKRNGLTKAQKAEAYDATQQEASLLGLMLGDVLAGEVVYGSWFKESEKEPGKYRAGISRINGCMGGLLIITWRYPNQRDSVTVYQLETELDNIRRARVGSETFEPILRAVLDAREKALSMATAA